MTSSQLTVAMGMTRARPGPGGKTIEVCIFPGTLEPRGLTLTQYDLMDLHRVARKWQQALGDNVILLTKMEWEALLEAWQNECHSFNIAARQREDHGNNPSGWLTRASEI